jgi:16S rRNA (adenine1518-N6/adenine1519-N6)-dimethyltransferase
MDAASPSAMLAKYGLAPSRRRGQCFLADENVARKIVESAAVGEDTVVVEIGPGFGAITHGLARRARHVIAVEVDEGIVQAFRTEYGDVPNITLVCGDVLDFDFADTARRLGVSKVLVVGNLPYSITSPVLRRLVEYKSVILRAVLMVQAEVGARIAADPGTRDYSALSVVMRFHARARSLFTVRRTCFYPKPMVDSRVVEFDFAGANGRSADPDRFSEVVHAAFAKRRKMLRQSLRSVLSDAGKSPAELEEESGVDLSRRGETLSVEEFASLADALWPRCARGTEVSAG